MPESLNSLLPTGGLAAPSHSQATGKNPYQEMLMRTPQLTAPRVGDERTLRERFWIDVEAGQRMATLGAGESVVFDRDQDEVDFTNPGDVEDFLRGRRIRASEARYNAMRPSRTPLETTVAVAGHLAGAALSPETFVALPTRLVTSGATALTRVLRAGASGAAINTAIDPVVQALRIRAGLQEHYSPSQTALAAALGLALPGTVQTGIEAITAPARRQVAREAARGRQRPGVEGIPPQPVEGRFVEPLRGEVSPELAPEAVPAERAPEPEVSPDTVSDAQRIETVADEIDAINRQVAPDIADDIAPAVSVPEVTVESLVAKYRAGMAKAGIALDGESAAELERVFRGEAERIVAERAGRVAAEVDDTAALVREVTPEIETAVSANRTGVEVTTPEGGNLKLRRDGDALIVDLVLVPEGQRGQGQGIALYESAIAYAQKQGLRFHSDNSLSTAAIRIYEGLERRGYDVRPNPTLVFTAGEAAGAATKDLKPAFEVVGGRPETIVAERAGRDAQAAPAEIEAAAATEAAPAVGEPIPEFRPDAVTPTPEARAGVFLFDPNDLQVDAQTFQFKSGGDVEGVTPILRGVTKWDPDAGGQLVVWQRADESLFIADGHQRVGLAKRLLTDGSEDKIEIPGSLYREADGWTAEEVMVIAAMKNIREGSGDVMDAARILRTRPEMIDSIAEIGRAQTRQAVALTGLSDEVWRMTVNDVLDPRDAAVIGRIITDSPELQAAAARLLVRLKPGTEAEASILVRRVKEAELVRQEEGVQGSLLGDLEGPDTTVAEEARIVARAVQTLSRDRNIMRRVAANAQQIERVGSRIERERTLSAADESGALAQIVEGVAFTRGEVRDTLLELARELKDGTRPFGDAVEAFIVALRRAERPGAAGRRAAGAGRPDDTAQGEDTTGAGLFGDEAEVPAGVAPEPPPAEPTLISTGTRLKSQTGRELVPAPKIDLGSDAKARNTLSRVDQWLVKEAIAEAEATGNDFVLVQMRGLDPKKLTPADRDIINQYLFGTERGATAEHVVEAPGRVAAMLEPEPRDTGIAVYHGSPNEFDRFDIERVGSGVGTNEGAGIYVTSDLAHARRFGDNVYRSVISAPEDRFIDYAKPMNEQSAFVRRALGDLADSDTTGREFVASLEGDRFDPRFGAGNARASLSTLGIVGGKFTEDGAPSYVIFDQRALTGPERLIEEPGAEGLPQLVLPGTERLTEAQMAQRRAAQPMRPAVAQARDAGPLFSDEGRQLDLVELARAAGQKEKGKTTLALIEPGTEPTARFAPGQDTHAFVGQLRGRPFRGESGRAKAGVAEGPATPQAQRLKDISDRLVAALGLTVRQGRLGKIAGKKPLGTFNEKSGAVRLRELDAFDVLAHEGGHSLHLTPANRTAIDALIARNQIEVERLAYQGTPQGQEGVEGFAEWFRLWLTNPNYAKREAPQFTQAAEGWLRQNRPQMFDDLVAAQTAYRDWLRAPSRDVVTGDLVSSGAPPIKERVGRAMETDRAPSGESLMSMFGRFYTWTLDRLHPVNRGVRVLLQIHKQNTGQSIDLPAASDPYKLLRLATSAHQAGHIDLIHGVVPYRGVDPQGPSLAEGLELAVGKNWHGSWRSDELIDFGAYMVARRSIVEFHRFMAGEVPNPPGKLTLGDYRQAVADFDAAYPNFAHAAQLIYRWQTNLLKKKFEAGLVSRSYYDKALAKPDYVPFQRDFSEKVEELIRPAGTGGTNRQSVMKTYRGSLRSIINPIESMMSEAYSTAAIIARNDAVAALADLAVKAGPGGGAIAELIPAKVVTPVRVDVLQALRNAGKDAGLDKADIDDLVLAASERLDSEDVIATLYKAGDAPEKGEPIVYYWRGGERHALRLADRRFGKDLYEAITQVGAEQSNWIINLLAVPARTLRMGITTSPEFLLANYIRDQTSAFVLNTRFIPFVSGARGIVDEVAQSRAARLYSQAGGLMGGANTASLDQARIGRSINALRRNGTIVRRVSDIRDVIKLTEISESGTRIALFKQYFDAARKRGLSEYEAMVEGAFQARDFIDFGRHGSKMLFARRVVTFMNAALQGTDKTLRTLINDLAPLAKTFRGETLTATERALVSRSAQAWLKIGVLTGLSATYALLYKDDPEWQQAGEYLRATHWLFKAPGGEWIAVPKPFEMATIMNFGERIAEGMASDDPTWADKWLRSWGYTLAVPIEPAGLMTPAEIGFNFDTFRQKPIVPQWDLGLEPWQQFNEYTSEFSKELGKAINVSPAKIDHLIVGWTGSWGRNALSVTNMFDPQRRSEQLYDWPVTGRFVKNLARGSDATDKFYGLISETSGRLERRNNAYREMISRGQEDQAAKFYDTLSDDEKAWVALNTMESADEKRLHPLRRASDVLRVFSGMRRDVANRNVITVLAERKIEVNPTIASSIADQLGRWAAAEARNAMIVIGEPGWAQREIMDVSPYADAIRQLSPDIANEIEDRLRKSKVLPFEGVRRVWPELRQRLLDEGPDAFVRDLRGDALGVSERSAAPVEVERGEAGEPTRIRQGAALGNVERGPDGRITRVVGPDGRVLADVRGRDARGRIRSVRTGILDRDVQRDEDNRALRLAA